MRRSLLLLLSACAAVPAVPDRPTGTLVAYAGNEDAVAVVITDESLPCRGDRRHIESVHVASGGTRWRADGWQVIVGRLAEEALLVSNEGAPDARGLELGVLDEREGQLLGRCAVSTLHRAGYIEWQLAGAGVVRGVVHEGGNEGGTPREPEPPFGVEARFGRWGCELVQLPSPPMAAPPVPSVSLWNVRLGDVTFTFPNERPPSIVAKRGDAVLWRKQVGVVDRPCLAP